MELEINSDLESFRSEGRRSQVRTGEKSVSPRKRRHTIVGINPSRTSSSRRWNVVSEFLTRLSSQIKSHESIEMGYVASEFESRVF